MPAQQHTVDPSARFEEIRIALPEPIHGLSELRGVLGIPEWWPTGARVAVVIAHGSSGNLDDPIIEHVHRELTEQKFLTLRFNFPFSEAGKRASADSAEVLDRALRAAIAVFGRDPTAAPAHLFIGGKGLGSRAAAQLASSGIRVDGLFFMGFPLHAQDRAEQIRAEQLYRIISPMLFVQGTRDRRCDLPTLRRVLSRVGAPTSLHVAEEADQNFRVLKRSSRSNPELQAEVANTVSAWIAKTLEGRP